MNKLLFPAVKLDGDRLLFSDADKTLIRAWVKDLPVPYFSVTFARPFRPRTTGKGSQSNRFNGFCAQICAATGDDFDRLKVELKQKAISRGYPFDVVHYKTADGVLVEMAIAKSEAMASVEDAKILIEVVEQDAAEKSVRLIE